MRHPVVEELPDLNLLCRGPVVVDFETTSFDPKSEAFNPYDGHRIAGIAVGNDSGSWYIPLRHRRDFGERHPDNVDLRCGLAWLQELFDRAPLLIGHNIKFDLKFAKVDGVECRVPIYDTMIVVRLINERTSSLKLKQIAPELTGIPATEEARLKRILADMKSKDYGDVPPSDMGVYACQDIELTWALFKWCEKNLPSELRELADNEHALLMELVESEARGVCLDETGTKLAMARCLQQAIKAEEKLAALTGFEVNPSAGNELKDLFVNILGVKPRAWTSTGQPSFDEEALVLYLNDPDEKVREVAQTILDYREPIGVVQKFAQPYLNLAVDGVLHPNYWQQGAKTGRLSCSTPNLQQVKPAARHFLIPRPGYWFLCFDYSQIEYRIFAHYCRDGTIIQRYLDDPNIDYHQWCADMLAEQGYPIGRKAAKSINFGLLYGMGLKKLLQSMAGASHMPIDERTGRAILAAFYEQVPTLRTLRTDVELVAKRRGYVKNLWGRRRHLNRNESYKALNAIVQGSAADLLKHKLVEVARALRAAGLDAYVLMNVHDELVIEVAESCVNETVSLVRSLMERVPQLRVPAYVDVEGSPVSWGAVKPLTQTA